MIRPASSHPPVRLLALLLAVSLVIAACSSKPEADKNLPAQTAAESRDSVLVSLAGRDSMTVFALLAESHLVDFVSSSMGVFVKGIDSVENGTDVFWVYSVNDTMAQVASDRYLTHDGDRIVWHFRKLSQSDN